jgi:TolB-like protein
MSLFAELKRRNVFRVGIAYLVAAWLLLQITDVLSGVLGLPEFVGKAVFLILLVGLVPALVFSWAYEITPEGVKREADVRPDESIGPQTARKLDIVVIAMLVAVAALVLYDRLIPEPSPPLGTADSAATKRADEAASESVAVKSAPAVDGTVSSVAVLPFVNMSPDPDNEYFSDGVSEEILNVLADVKDLRVAARTSSFAFRGSSLGISEIADQLGVDYVLEGSVRKSGDQVRITAQLIQAGDGFHVWSESYDRTLTNIFAIQDEIAASIADVLEVQLSDRGRAYTRVNDLEPEVYEQFLKARFLLRRRNEADENEAIRLLQEIVTAEPRFPGGLALLAEGLTQRLNMARFRGRTTGPDDRAEIQGLVSRALDLEPELALAHLIDAYLAISDNDPLEVIRKMQRAVELDPSEPRPHHWLAVRYQLAGYLERARSEAQIAVDLDPENANTHAMLGTTLLLLGDFASAEAHFREQLRLGNPSGASNIIRTAVLAGEAERARILVDELPWSQPQDRERSERFVDAIEDRSRIPEFVSWVSRNTDQHSRADYELFALGRFEEAFELTNAEGLAWADYWSEARTLPAFEASIEEARLPDVWDAIGPPPACRKVAGRYDCGPGD